MQRGGGVMADWKKIEAEYITTETSYRKLADKYGVDQATIARRAKKHDWVSKRQHHADKTQAKLLAQISYVLPLLSVKVPFGLIVPSLSEGVVYKGFFIPFPSI